jgi:hypothetical protein
MSTVAFCSAPVVLGYQGDPVSQFTITVDYNIYNDAAVGYTQQGSVTVNLGLTDSIQTLYPQVYADISATCQNLGWDVPPTSSVFAIAPTPLSSLITL